MSLLIRSNPASQAEKAYTWHVLFREILGLDYVLVFEPTEHGHELCLPNGQQFFIPDTFDSLHPASDWNFQLDTKDYQSPDFDVFAFCFFMLSRLEEYQTSHRDAHGRFPAKASWAFRNGVLDRPVVNECANWLWEKLQRAGFTGERKLPEFRWSFSCDVDHPRLWWTGAARLKTLAGALLKRRSITEAQFWLKQPGMFRRSAADPYDVFEEWMNLFDQYGHVIQWNFMGQRAPGSDCWYPLENPFIKKLILNLAERGHTIGFHPGYESYNNQDAFNQELNSLQELSPVAVKSGRQHYLRFSNPETWQVWEKAGMEEDSTLGYAEADGFRSGICQSYPAFDLSQRKMLHLREKPLVLMDVTLAQYLRLTPEQGIAKIRYYHKVVKQYGGELTLLWHNSSWNTPFWTPWKKVFLESLRLD